MSILLLSHWLYFLTQLSWLTCVESECYTMSCGIPDNFKLAAAAQFLYHRQIHISICCLILYSVGFSLVWLYITHSLALKLLYKISLSICLSVCLSSYLFNPSIYPSIYLFTMLKFSFFQTYSQISILKLMEQV